MPSKTYILINYTNYSKCKKSSIQESFSSDGLLLVQTIPKAYRILLTPFTVFIDNYKVIIGVHWTGVAEAFR